MVLMKEFTKTIRTGVWGNIKSYVYAIVVAVSVCLSAKYSLNWLVVNSIYLSLYITMILRIFPSENL